MITSKKTCYLFVNSKNISYLCIIIISNTITLKKTRLNELAEVLSGIYAKPKPDGDVAYIQTKDCVGKVQCALASRLSSTPKLEKYLLCRNDILFAAKGVNYMSVVFDGTEKAVASTSFFVIRLRADNVLPEYLCWYLQQPLTKAYFMTYQVGTATPLIHKPAVENLTVAVPPLPVQQRIVEIARLAQREEQLQQQIAERKQAVLQQQLMNIIQ